MRCGLRAVEQDGDATLARLGDEAPHRHDRAERVRDVREGDEARALRKKPQIRLEIHLAGSRDRDHAQLRAGLLAHHLPGNDIGVVLEPGDQDLVARR